MTLGVRTGDYMPLTFLARRESFSAAHRLHSPQLSDEENLQVYGKCNWDGGHGHNYQLEVTLTGPVDPRTGMLINLVDLKRIIWEVALDHLDHRNLDRDVPFFLTLPSTTENVAKFIWERLESAIPSPASLFEVKLYETEKNYVILRDR